MTIDLPYTALVLDWFPIFKTCHINSSDLEFYLSNENCLMVLPFKLSNISYRFLFLLSVSDLFIHYFFWPSLPTDEKELEVGNPKQNGRIFVKPWSVYQVFGRLVSLVSTITRILCISVLRVSLSLEVWIWGSVSWYIKASEFAKPWNKKELAT